MHESFFRQKRSVLTQTKLNLVPFIDVLLILVVLLMTSVSTLQKAIIVNLPKDSSVGVTDPHDQEPLLLSLTKNKKMYLEHPLIPREALEPKDLFLKLKALKIQNLAQDIFVAADQECQYNDVMDMISLVNRSGYTRVTLVTDKEHT